VCSRRGLCAGTCDDRGSSTGAVGIAELWIDLCQTLDLPPNVTHPAMMVGERPDFTVCFVDPSTRLTTGYKPGGNSAWRWLSLAIATGGKLRLNSPEEEADVPLNGVGESPGWIVCGAGALITDENRRQLQLYQGDWIPSWVEPDQVDHLIDNGVVIAAEPGRERPADQYPIGSASALEKAVTR
jgi:hypothetical protein